MEIITQMLKHQLHHIDLTLRALDIKIAYEVPRNLEMTTKRERKLCTRFSDKKLALVSLLRLDYSVLDLIPSARSGFARFYRDEATLKSVKCYFNVPNKLD